MSHLGIFYFYAPISLVVLAPLLFPRELLTMFSRLREWIEEDLRGRIGDEGFEQFDRECRENV